MSEESCESGLTAVQFLTRMDEYDINMKSFNITKILECKSESELMLDDIHDQEMAK